MDGGEWRNRQEEKPRKIFWREKVFEEESKRTIFNLRSSIGRSSFDERRETLSQGRNSQVASKLASSNKQPLRSIFNSHFYVPLTSLQFPSRHFLQRTNIPDRHVLIKSSYQSKLCTIAVPSPGITQDSSRKPDPASQCRTSNRNTKNQQHSCFPSKSHGAHESCIVQYRSRGEKEGGLQK